MQTKNYKTIYFKFMSVGLILATINLSFINATSKDTVTLVAGTSIALETLSTINTNQASAGQIVDFKVRQDISVDGKVVIKAGTIAKGQILRANKPKEIGKEGFLEIQIKSVTAVDGQEILLTGGNVNSSGDSKQTLSIVLGVVVCILFLLMKGKDAEVPAGYTTVANTAVNTDIAI